MRLSLAQWIPTLAAASSRAYVGIATMGGTGNSGNNLLGNYITIVQTPIPVIDLSDCIFVFFLFNDVVNFLIQFTHSFRPISRPSSIGLTHCNFSILKLMIFIFYSRF